MTTYDAIADAFGFGEIKNYDWFTLGKVTAVDGTKLKVLLGGSSVPADCESYCYAQVGDVVLVVIMKGIARAIAKRGNVLSIPDSAVADASQAPSANQYGSALHVTDQQGEQVGYLGLVHETNDNLWTQLGVTRDVNGSPVYNSLWLGLADDGTPIVHFGDATRQQAWQKALGIGTVKELDVSSNVSVATSTNKSLGSLTLEAGKWVVEYGTFFSSASSGIASTFLYTSKDVGASAYWYRATCVQTAVSGSNTWHQGSTILNLTASTTVYLTVWHNTGSAKNCQGQMRAIKVG